MTDELVEKMLDAAIYLPNATAEQSMTAALAIARPIIEREALEKAAECAIDNQDCDPWEIADAIRALMEKSK